jgi:hypothetical protein
MSRVFLACAFAALVPVAARGEPISIAVNAGSGGFTQGGSLTGRGTTIDLGQLGLTPGASGTFFFNDARAWRDYQLSFDLNLTGVSGFMVELLDPLGDGNDTLDPLAQPVYVPVGYSTSNNADKLSFAQGSGLERSAIFAGGSALVTADEITHRGDMLIFSGLSGAEAARVTFGLRDSLGGRGFLMRISAIGGNAATAPEPASMLLVGTGLAGLAALRRRRRRQAAAAQLAS